MKALSLWQPWASAIAIGAKCIETRSWETLYRGPLLIHAASTRGGLDVAIGDPPEACNNSMRWERILRIDPDVGLGDAFEDLPFGALIATCELHDCVRTDDLAVTNREHFLGDYSLGRFAWLLRNVRALSKPIPFRGRQRLFDVPDEALDVAKGVG